MSDNEQDDSLLYDVVKNHEEQYSIWRCGREIPPGWEIVGTTGTKKACLDHINEVWTDMRPLSLRRQMDDPETATPDNGSED